MSVVCVCVPFLKPLDVDCPTLLGQKLVGMLVRCGALCAEEAPCFLNEGEEWLSARLRPPLQTTGYADRGTCFPRPFPFSFIFIFILIFPFIFTHHSHTLLLSMDRLGRDHHDPQLRGAR